MVTADELHVDVVKLLTAAEVVEDLVEINLSFLLDVEGFLQVGLSYCH